MHEQILEECERLRIPATTWKDHASGKKMVSYRNGLLVVSPEDFVAPSFQSTIKKVGFRDGLRRICLDEAQVCFSWAEFRECMAQIGRFRPLRQCPQSFNLVPIMALSGTCPKFVEDIVLSSLDMDHANLITISNPQRNRKIQLLAEIYQTKQAFAEGIWIWVEHLARTVTENLTHGRTNRCIVYTEKKHDARRIVEYVNSIFPTLRAECFTGDLTLPEKSRVHKSWKERSCNFLACTSAYGLGIHDPTASAILRVGLGRSCMQLIQEAGRAGRSNDSSKAVCVTLSCQPDVDLARESVVQDGNPNLLADFQPLSRGFTGQGVCLGATVATFLELPGHDRLDCEDDHGIYVAAYCTACLLGDAAGRTTFGVRKEHLECASIALHDAPGTSFNEALAEQFSCLASLGNIESETFRHDTIRMGYNSPTPGAVETLAYEFNGSHLHAASENVDECGQESRKRSRRE